MCVQTFTLDKQAQHSPEESLNYLWTLALNNLPPSLFSNSILNTCLKSRKGLFANLFCHKNLPDFVAQAFPMVKKSARMLIEISWFWNRFLFLFDVFLSPQFDLFEMFSHKGKRVDSSEDCSRLQIKW